MSTTPARASRRRRPNRPASITTFAKQATVSTRTVHRRIADGTLPAWKVGHLVRVDLDDVDRLFRPVGAAGGSDAA